MSPVIRIDDEVMAELKKRAIGLGLVFEPPNTTLRSVLGLGSQASSHHEAAALAIQARQQRSDKEYMVEGKIYCQNAKIDSLTWEIGRFKSPGRDSLPSDIYPFVPRDGTYITLVIRSKEYPARFHHYESGGSYIGRSRDNALSIKGILEEHGLAKHNMPVTLRFHNDKVYLV